MSKQELASIIVPAVCSLIPARDFSQDRLEDGDTQSCPVIIFGLCETTKAFFFNSLHLDSLSYLLFRVTQCYECSTECGFKQNGSVFQRTG
jgi:hypothetical protein